MSYDKAIGQLKNGPSKPNLFKVVMPQRFIDRETNDYLEYFCTVTQVPSVRYDTIQRPGHSNMGIMSLQPSVPIFTNPFEIIVIENSDLTVHRAFKEWFDETAENIDQTGSRNIRLNYYKQIVGDIELTKLENPDSQNNGDNEYKEPLKVKFINAYIKSIGQLDLNSSPMTAPLQFKVEFNYESYTTEYE